MKKLNAWITARNLILMLLLSSDCVAEKEEKPTDIGLLKCGFHVEYCDVAELFGNDKCLKMDADFYHLLRNEGLPKNSVMDGMSRGGVYALNWAAETPDKVSVVYIDNSLLFMKSWPCGLGKREPAVDELVAFRKDYNITSDEQMKTFNNNPIDKVDQIAKGGYSILILCADAEEPALPDENTLLFLTENESAEW